MVADTLVLPDASVGYHGGGSGGYRGGHYYGRYYSGHYGYYGGRYYGPRVYFGFGLGYPYYGYYPYYYRYPYRYGYGPYYSYYPYPYGSYPAYSPPPVTIQQNNCNPGPPQRQSTTPYRPQNAATAKGEALEHPGAELLPHRIQE